MNVIGSRPDGWWRDRAAARRALVSSLTLQTERYDRVIAVFDGQPSRDEIEDAAQAGVTAIFAPGGPNAADAAIVAFVSRAAVSDAEEIVVVTSDAMLAADARSLGATVQASGAFRKSLDADEPD